MDARADSDEQVVLEELYDENYEPTEAEILEYAKWLGMDTDNEKELLWIARAGLKEPVPEGWKPCQAPSKEIYYFNFITGESIWDHPCDERFRKLYAQEKERLQERLAAGQDQQHALQQHVAPNKAPQLLLSSGDDAIQHTVVEPLQIPLASPSGTLSTIASATTVSMAESPVGGLAQGGNGEAFSMEAAQQQQQQDTLAGDRSSPARGHAGVAAGGQQQQQPTSPPAALTGSVRAAVAGSADGNSTDATMAAAIGWQAEEAAADQQERLHFRQHLDEERRLWEQHMQAELHAQHAAVHDQHQERLWSLTQELQEQERRAVAQLKVEQDARLTALRMELQATLKDLEHELQDAKTQHAAHMEQLRRQHTDLEVRANSMLQQAQQRLSQTALTDSEVSAARDKAAAATELEVFAEAAGQRSQLLDVAMQRVEQEVAGEVAAYKASRKAEALMALAGELSEDTVTAAQQLEQHTAELRRLEAAVTDKAAVLQKLNDELLAKQQQQQRSLGSTCESCGGGAGQLLGACTEQLTAVQQQLSQAERQLAAADAGLIEKRAAVAEAEEQLASVRRETSVCEPRLSSLKQQLQELEATIRARDTEQQQRQADVALSTKRLQELREEATRRQAQLESLEALYSERQESLRQTANELAWRRGELSTLESSLSESLRRQADTEYQAVEEQLRRTRKAAADATSDLAAKQVTLNELSSQLSSKQLQLEGVEASLAAKSRELADVLAQLQAAAAQEFQDAKKLLLEEEARLLDSERRSMQVRVADQVESERRAALAAGRRRIERELSTQLAEQQTASLERQQKQVKQWLEGAGGPAPMYDSSSRPHANGRNEGMAHNHAADSLKGPGVAALLGQQQSHAAQKQKLQQKPRAGHQQQHAGIRPGSVHSMPDMSNGVANGQGGEEEDEEEPGFDGAAGADYISSSTRRRARSHSPVRQWQQHPAANGTPARASAELNSQQHIEGHSDRASGVPPGSQSAQQQQQQHMAGGGVAAGLHAAAAAVISQLRSLGAHQGQGTDSSSSWLDAAERDLQAPAELQALNQQVPAGAQLSAYSSLLQHARHFIKQRRRDIQARQQAVMAAQADWRAVLSAMEEQQRLQLQQQQQQDDAGGGGAVGSELSQAVQQLRQLKGVLQEQIRGLNEETQQVKSLKARVQQLKATVDLLQLHGGPQQQQQQQQQQQPDPAISTLSSLLTSLSGLQEKQQHWQHQHHQQPQAAQPQARHNSSRLSSAPGGRLQHYSQQYQQQQHSSAVLPQQQHQHQQRQQASPLDKVTVALQAALDAATSWSDAVGESQAGSGAPAALDRGGGGGFAAQAVGASSSSSRRSSLQPWHNGASALAPLQQNGQQLPGLAGEGSWGTLNKLCEERGAAQQAMRQHSQWLQGFREQVAQVAALQPAVATKLQQHSRTVGPAPRATRAGGLGLHDRAQAAPAAAAVPAAGGSAPTGPAGGNDAAGGGGGHGCSGSTPPALSPVASSGLLPCIASAGSLTLGQPVTVDLGGDQELVISVVHKGASGVQS